MALFYLYSIMTKTKINGRDNKITFIFAHGAGAPMDSEWMNDVTKRLVLQGIRVVRFEFPYMADRRLTGTKRPPNKKDVLLETFKEVILQEAVKSQKLFIGGKSMGARMASLILDEVAAVTGLIAFGFPFHAPGKDPKDRINHLHKLKKPCLILQGERDPMGNREECRQYKLSKKIEFEWLVDGDHSLKPRKKSGITLQENMDKAIQAAQNFINKNI